MKLDYSKRYTDKRGSAILKGITANGDTGFFRRELPDGKPVTWADYDAGCGGCPYWSYQNSRTLNIVEIDAE